MAKIATRPFDEPPEREQTLALSLLVTAAYLPLVGEVQWQITAFLALLLGIRLAALRWPATAPGTLSLAALTVAGGANCLLAYRTLAGQDGGAALFVTMLALKLLEVRSRRDLRVAGILLWFLIAIEFLFEQSIGRALYLGAICLAGLALQVDLDGSMGPDRLRGSAAVALRVAVHALPLTLALFVLFPRLSSPLWNLGLDTNRGITGMSDRLELGSVGDLVLNGELAFRARFEGRAPPSSRLYWRGLVLWQPDERGWSLGPVPGRGNGEASRLKDSTDLVDYEVLLEPSGKRWLFALDMPVRYPLDGQLTADLQLLADRPVTSPRRVRLRSALAYRTPDPTPEQRELALKLPPNVTARMHRLAAGWRAEAADDWGVVEAALGYFHREAFHYTLLPPKLGANPADEFLFETRKGFCEHYASSFALLMRSAGIPSRVVLGYLGGERNRIGGYHMIWQSDAHAWAEVAIPGRGWVRVDPTAAVDPARIDNRSAQRLLGGMGAPVRFQVDGPGAIGDLLRQARLLVDSLDTAWQEWVLDFSEEHQRSVLAVLGLDRYREAGLAVLMVASGALAMGLVMWGLVSRGECPDPLSARYGELCRRLARAGLPKREGEGPCDYGRRVGVERPDLAEPVERFLKVYVGARYGRRPFPEAARDLAHALRGFRPTRRGGGRGLSADKRREPGETAED